MIEQEDPARGSLFESDSSVDLDLMGVRGPPPSYDQMARLRGSASEPAYDSTDLALTRATMALSSYLD